MNVRKHIPVSEAERAAAIDRAFQASARRRAMAQFERNARAAVTSYRVERAAMNPKAAFLALFRVQGEV